MRKLLSLLVITLVVMFTGCTDAQMGKITSLGDGAHIVCYSGGSTIYDGYSTGKVSSEEKSDGYFFKEAKTGEFKEVSGDCIITYQ